jgi:hypothetical protein
MEGEVLSINLNMLKLAVCPGFPCTSRRRDQSAGAGSVNIKCNILNKLICDACKITIKDF